MKAEGSLIAFTLLLEWGVGTFLIARVALPIANGPGEILALSGGALAAVALGLSLFHLGVPSRAFLALRNWRTSPLSREVGCGLVFLLTWGSWALASPRWAAGIAWQPLRDAVGWGVAGLGLITVLSVGAVYRATSLEAWNRFFTLVAHLATALWLGACSVAAAIVLGSPHRSGLRPVLWIAIGAGGVLLSGFPSYAQVVRGAEPMRRLTGLEMPRWWVPLLAARMALLSAACAVIAWMILAGNAASASEAIALAVVSLASEICGRWLFYSTAVPRLP